MCEWKEESSSQKERMFMLPQGVLSTRCATIGWVESYLLHSARAKTRQHSAHKHGAFRREAEIALAASFLPLRLDLVSEPVEVKMSVYRMPLMEERMEWGMCWMGGAVIVRSEGS